MSFDAILRVLPLDADTETIRLTAEAALFGAAGLLPDSPTEHGDSETQAYASALREKWAEIQRNLRLSQTTEPIAWAFKDARPANYPPRRLAGFAAFLARCLPDGIVRTLLAVCETAKTIPDEKEARRALLKQWTSLLTEPVPSYWLYRSRWGERTLGRPTRLIGRQRAEDIVVNVFLPGLLAQARESGQTDIEQFLHTFFDAIRPNSGDRVTRLMSRRLFRDADHEKEILNSFRRQQGLHQIYRDCCQKTGGACRGCLILDLAAALSDSVPENEITPSPTEIT